MACFHICWSDGKLDWECHRTQAQAESRAKQLVKEQETFTTVQCAGGSNTPKCPYVRYEEKWFAALHRSA